MTELKFCRQCAHSYPEVNSEWNLRCHNPHVVIRDDWAMSSAKNNGSDCRSERAQGWLRFPACGKSGKLFEPINFLTRPENLNLI